MTDVAYAPRRTSWVPTWNGIKLGTTMEVDPQLKLMLDAIRRGTTGKVVLGHWVSGVEGTIKIQCPDVGATLFTAINPFAPSLAPTVFNDNLYAYAHLLNLHPLDMGATTTEDLNFPKAAPVSCATVKRSGDKDEMLVVEFWIYPDLSQLITSTPKIVQGYQGATAP